MARIVLSLLLFCGFLALSQPARAYDDAYTVRDVKVDILAESAVKARDKAFGAAQKAAFLKLASRYRSQDELKTLTPPDAQTIAGMIQDFEIQNEQLSTKRYVGLYTFRFKGNVANRYFGGSPVYTEASSELPARRAALMVLPFFQAGKNTAAALWDTKQNPFLLAWQQTSLEGNPALVLPLGDVSDMMDVRDNQVTTYNPAGLKRILKRYEARDAVILLARFNQGAAYPVEIDVYRTDRRPPELIKTIQMEAGSSRTLGELLTRAVAETKDVLAGNWKLQTIVDDEAAAAAAGQTSVAQAAAADAAAVPAQPKPYKPMSGQVRVQTSFASITEWLELRRSLNSVPALTGVKIVALKSNEAIVELSYADWPSLNNGLGAKGLSISSRGEGNYQLQRRNAPAMPFYR